MSVVQTINPATAIPLATYQQWTWDEVELELRSREADLKRWFQASVSDRVMALNKVRIQIHSQQNEVAHQITLEMGKPLAESKAEVSKSLEAMAWFCDQAPSIIEDQTVSRGAFSAQIMVKPLGWTLGVMPWNFPVWQVIRYAIPSLLVGNGVLVKSAPNVWGTAKLLHDLFSDLGVYVHLPIGVETVAALISDQRVRGVSVTGSDRAGRAVAELCGRHLKKCVLELGGSDAYMILDDANLEIAAKKLVLGRTYNAGQSCISAKRWFVDQRVFDQFRALAEEEMSKIVLGDPLLATTHMGPLARLDLCVLAQDQWQRLLKAGAQVLWEGKEPHGKGFYFAPRMALMDEVKGFDEEIFAPLAQVWSYSDETRALSMINASRFGLGGGVFSNSLDRARDVLTQMDIGMGVINDFFRSRAELPFGGVKDSGFGREMGDWGFFEFANIKVMDGGSTQAQS